MVQITFRTPTYTIADTATSSTFIYIGKSEIGSSKSDDVWQIFRVDKTSGAEILYADGNAAFNNIWDNRVSLSYS